MTPSEVQMFTSLNVSRETMDRLIDLSALVIKWTKAINLVSASTISDLFHRHILDSAQIFNLAPTCAKLWADLGSGGGFPGLVVACMAAEKSPDLNVVLVEGDQRKCAFLRHASVTLGLATTILDQRIETCSPLMADVVSARALAPLGTLCIYAHRHLRPAGTAIFHKGANHTAELELARKDWRFGLTKVRSTTDPDAVILKIEGLSHV